MSPHRAVIAHVLLLSTVTSSWGLLGRDFETCLYTNDIDRKNERSRKTEKKIARIGNIQPPLGQQNALDMELCMGCICEATSNCNLTFQCTRGLCGPFLISNIYWNDAGRPVVPGDNPNRKGAYYRCVTEPYCAALAVQRYIGKYAQDCNGDGVIDCDDYARIHYMGGRQCKLNMNYLGYYKVFRECKRSLHQLTR